MKKELVFVQITADKNGNYPDDTEYKKICKLIKKILKNKKRINILMSPFEVRVLSNIIVKDGRK